MPGIEKLFTVLCNQCGRIWAPRTAHPQRCVNPECQARDWNGPKRTKRKYTKSW